MNLSTILEELDDLPPTPQILPRLQTLLRDPNSEQSDLVALLRLDSGLTTRIIRLANSAYFAARQPSENISDAVTRLGFNDVFRVTSLAIAGQVLGAALPAYHLKAGELAERSLACASMLSAFRMSPTEPVDSETRYTVGLLHAVGKIVVNHYFHQRGLEVYGDDPEQEITPDQERAMLSFDHAEAGAEVLRQWHFPKRTCDAIRWQFEPERALRSSVLAARLNVATWGAPYVSRKPAGESEPPKFSGDPEILRRAQLQEEEVSDAMEAARAAFAETRGMMHGS